MMVRAAFAMILLWVVWPLYQMFLVAYLTCPKRVFTGYIPNATALIASQVPKDKTGMLWGPYQQVR